MEANKKFYADLEEEYQQSETAKLIERKTKAINEINDGLHISDKAFALGLTLACVLGVGFVMLLVKWFA